MKTIAILFLTSLTTLAQAPIPLAQRIRHTDTSKMRAGRSHGSVGDMNCMTLVDRNAIPLLNFVHRCQMMAPNGGVGHHFHNQNEEMFVIFDGEAEFTIDGRTSLLKGTVGAPTRLGHSHAIRNTTGKPVEFMNINVATVSGEYDAFNLEDPRLDVPKDPIPVFMTMRLDKALFTDRNTLQAYRGGRGSVKHRHALDRTVFLSNWAYVDHLIIPSGSSEGMHRHPKLGEVYYVLNGTGEVTLAGQTAAIRKGDGLPISPNEPHSFANNSGQDLELMIIGVSTEKGNTETIEVK